MILTLGQAVTAFIFANLFGILVHLAIMIRTGGEYKQRILTLESDVIQLKKDTIVLQVQMAAITQTAGGIHYGKEKQ